MHKISWLSGNFVLSLCAIQASIDMHVRTPDDGGCGPLQEPRLGREAVSKALDLRIFGPDGLQRSLGNFGSLRPSRARPSGRVAARAAAFGPEIGRLRRLFGDVAGCRDVSVEVRGRRASSEVVRPAPKVGLPCRYRLLEGRCRSNFGSALSGDGGFPSPVSGRLPVRDRAASREDARGLIGQRGFLRGIFTGLGGDRASGHRPET